MDICDENSRSFRSASPNACARKKPVIFEEVFHATKNAHLLPRKLRAREEGNWELTIACCELPITLSNSWVVENADAIAATDASKVAATLAGRGRACYRLCSSWTKQTGCFVDVKRHSFKSIFSFALDDPNLAGLM